MVEDTRYVRVQLASALFHVVCDLSATQSGVEITDVDKLLDYIAVLYGVTVAEICPDPWEDEEEEHP